MRSMRPLWRATSADKWQTDNRPHFFVVRGRLNVHERARGFEKIHSIQSFLDERTKGRNRENTNRGCRLSIALHPIQRMTVDRPWTCPQPPRFQLPLRFGGQHKLSSTLPVERRAPFARTSEAARNCLPATHGLRTSTKKLKNRRAMGLCQSDFAAPTYLSRKEPSV